MKFSIMHLAVLVYGLSFGNTTWAQTDVLYIPAYTYHLKPPFIIDQSKEESLYYDLVEQLSDERFQYYLVYIPRKRIDRMLSEKMLDGIVVGVSPHWFKDNNTEKYNWTFPFMTDRDDIVSPASKPYEFSQANLRRKTMAGVRGFFYVNVDPFAEKMDMQRFNTDSETSVLEMVIRKRVDFGIVSSSTFNYLRKDNTELQSLHVSTTPHEAFHRRILIPKQLPELHSHLQAGIKTLMSKQAWEDALAIYGLQRSAVELEEMAANASL